VQIGLFAQSREPWQRRWLSLLLVAKQVESSTAPEDISEALDELNELGVLDTLDLFENDEREH
jgi:hypothetical protein